MTRYDPEEIIDVAERERATIREHYLPAAEWFLENPGLSRRPTVVEELAENLDVDRAVAGAIVGHLVSDDVDPVQQVVRPTESTYVGIISHAEHDWFYAFDRYDDVDGRQRRAVCAHCVREERSAADVAHFTRPPAEYDVERARAALALHYHVDHEGRDVSDVLAADLGVDPAAFADRHGLAGPDALSLRAVTRRLDADPDLRAWLSDVGDRLAVPEVDVEPGASLVSGTTIGGNTAWHAGNDGTGSGLDADTLDGKQATDLRYFLRKDQSGNAYIRTTSDTFHGTIPRSTSAYTTTTLTPTNSWDVAFLTTSHNELYFAFEAIKRNGTTVSPNTPGVLVRDVSTGETFQFVFHTTYSADALYAVIGIIEVPQVV